MKIGITCYPTYGGSGVVATELGMELAARGHEIHFISYAQPFRLMEISADLAVCPNISYHEVEVQTYPLFDYPPYALALATTMAEVATHYGLDLLHVHYAIPHSVSAYLAQTMLDSRPLPFVTTLHGTDITLVGQARSYLPITRFAIEQSDGVTAVSNYLKEVTEQKLNVRKPIQVIPNFVNCERYQRTDHPALRERFAPNGERLIAHLSNFRPVKRLPDVVEIFGRIQEDVPSRLLLIGDGPLRANVEYLVREKGLGNAVSFLGKQDVVHELLAVCDLFLLPSELETFGVAALEAMACEVPVIATNVGGLPELIVPGEGGCLLEPGDVEGMARCAVELLRDPERNREMGRRARQAAQSRFCSSRIIPQYETFYGKLLENSNRS